MINNQEFIKIDYANHQVKMGIWVVGFKDNEKHIAYVPSLNLTAYGDTEEDAIDMLFEDVFKDYAENILNSKESDVRSELAKYGWEKSKLMRKKFYNTPYIDESGILKNFNLPKETPIKASKLQYA